MSAYQGRVAIQALIFIFSYKNCLAKVKNCIKIDIERR